MKITILFILAIILTATHFYNKGLKKCLEQKEVCPCKNKKLIPDLVKSKSGKTVKVLRDKKGHFAKKPKIAL